LEILTQEWQLHLKAVFPDQPEAVRASILAWLLGSSPEGINALDDTGRNLLVGTMHYRIRILQNRYLNPSPPQGYRLLMRRLASATLVRQKVQRWLNQSRDPRSLMMVLEEVISEMLGKDNYLRQQATWIQACTPLPRLRHSLLFVALEEYALRPIQNQPLIVLRILNHLKRCQRGGVTQVPAQTILNIRSNTIFSQEESQDLEHCDVKALACYEQDVQNRQRQHQRCRVQREFEGYLSQTLGELHLRWFRLYLQGYTQEHIAQQLGLPIKKVYRLREKVSYHAIKIFSLRVQPELVADWLETSLRDHHLGLTPSQWQCLMETLTPLQQLILRELDQGKSMAQIVTEHHLKLHQATMEWFHLCLRAQQLRAEA
jgi:hypothetical protein